MVTGQGLAGFYAVFAQILSLVGGLSPLTSALYYFISADVALIASFVVFLYMRKSVSLTQGQHLDDLLTTFISRIIITITLNDRGHLLSCRI